MVMPPVTTGYLLLLLLGTNGVLGKWMNEWLGIRIAFSFGAAVIAAIVVSFPLIIRSVKVAMQMVDPGLEEASKSLGASPVKTFLLITLPLAWPGILGGFVLAFARSLGEFGATITFAGNIEGETRTLPLAIYAKMQVPGQEGETFALVAISVVISFVAIIGSHYAYRND
jgi:molybdate transport system permease protein